MALGTGDSDESPQYTCTKRNVTKYVTNLPKKENCVFTAAQPEEDPLDDEEPFPPFGFSANMKGYS